MRWRYEWLCLPDQPLIDWWIVGTCAIGGLSIGLILGLALS